MSGRFCTVEDLKRQAITIKLYNNSVWANLGDGRFINRQTKQIRPIFLLYRSTRTVVGVNHQVNCSIVSIFCLIKTLRLN